MIVATCNDLDDSPRRYVEFKKSDTENYIWIFPCMYDCGRPDNGVPKDIWVRIPGTHKCCLPFTHTRKGGLCRRDYMKGFELRTLSWNPGGL